jgi:WXG100 family type VII secretion target
MIVCGYRKERLCGRGGGANGMRTGGEFTDLSAGNKGGGTMARSINVNPANLDRVANNLNNIANDAAGVKNLLSQAESNVNLMWRSRHTGMYLDEVRTVRDNMKRIENKLDSLSAALRQEASNVRKVEAENRMMFVG